MLAKRAVPTRSQKTANHAHASIKFTHLTCTKHFNLLVMMLLLTATFVFLAISSTAGDRIRGCHKEPSTPIPTVVLTKQPYQYVNWEDLPENFDWGSMNGTSYVTPATNQFLPSPCGSCWAHASTGALTDRFVIATKAKVPVVRISPQPLLDCLDLTESGGCDGGSSLLAYKYVYDHGITDVTCSPYMGVTQSNWGEGVNCSQRMCRQCDVHGNCQFVTGTKYHVSEYGQVTGEKEMMAEIYKRGPIACSIYAHTDAFEKYTSGIISDPMHYPHTTHVVAITGWGISDKGVKYWIGRNSFGSEWGEYGWFQLERGTNCLLIEEHFCAWAVPDIGSL